MERWTSLLVLMVATVQLVTALSMMPKPDERRTACAEMQCGLGEMCIMGEEGEPKCVCSQVCTNDYSPLCATNGRTYVNLCTMEAEACLNGIHLDVLMYKDCKFVFMCGGAIVGLAFVTMILMIVLVVRCCQRRRTPRRMAFVIDDYTSEAFFPHSNAIYKPTTIKTKSVSYDKIPILSNYN